MKDKLDKFMRSNAIKEAQLIFGGFAAGGYILSKLNPAIVPSVLSFVAVLYCLSVLVPSFYNKRISSKKVPRKGDW